LFGFFAGVAHFIIIDPLHRLIMQHLFVTSAGAAASGRTRRVASLYDLKGAALINHNFIVF
jgi:hypothetical protein